MIIVHKAIRKAYPNVLTIDGNLNCFDENGDIVVVDMLEVEKVKPIIEEELMVQAIQKQRAKEYPPIGDQLDTLYHGGYDAWKAQIQAVKNKYPKE